MNERLERKQKAFKEVCYSDKPQETLRNLLANNIIGIQQFHIKHENHCKAFFNELCNNKECNFQLKWMVGSASTNCRYCGKYISPEDFTITYSYWSAHWYPSHKHCHQAGTKQEAYDCQLIDADCNDCKYFRRDKFIYGTCQKFNKPTEAYSNHCSGYKCFEHRRNES